MKKQRIQAALIMGSKSDLKVLKPAIDLFKEWGVPLEVQIVSAHRTPKFMKDYGESAEERGLKVIMAAAGGAAHLPGMTASFTGLPVIGIPVTSSKLKGLDSLLSVVQMPKGVPVACVAVDGAFNAGLLALKILSLLPENTKIQKKLKQFQQHQKKQTLKSNRTLKDFL